MFSVCALVAATNVAAEGEPTFTVRGVVVEVDIPNRISLKSQGGSINTVKLWGLQWSSISDLQDALMGRQLICVALEDALEPLVDCSVVQEEAALSGSPAEFNLFYTAPLFWNAERICDSSHGLGYSATYADHI